MYGVLPLPHARVANRLPMVYRAGGFVFFFVAVVAQLVEPRIVIPVVAGSSPVDRPISPFLVS